jgi:hypothetical protein
VIHFHHPATLLSLNFFSDSDKDLSTKQHVLKPQMVGSEPIFVKTIPLVPILPSHFAVLILIQLRLAEYGGLI